MNIVVITCPFGALPPDAIGAVEKLFYLLALEWKKMDHRVTFVCAGGGDADGIEFVRLKKYKRTGSTKKDLIWDFMYSIKALWKCPKTDILLCNTFWTPCLAPLFRWKYKRLVYGVHRYPKGQFFLYPFVHLFICVSTVVADALCQELHGSKRVSRINNPIDTKVFSSRDTLPKGKRVIIAYAGRIHPEKGLEILFSACELIARKMEIELRVFGVSSIEEGGGGERYINDLLSLSPTVKVSFAGALRTPEELSRRLSECTMFVYPSKAVKGETFGVAPLEAMSLGLPTILSDLPCFGDYAQNQFNCIQFQLGKNEVEECRQAIERICCDLNFRKYIADNARGTAQNFSVGQIAAEYICAFMKCLNK